MDLLQNLSDDQTALLGCFAALLAAGLVMTLSYYLGRWNTFAHGNRPAEAIAHRLPASGDEQSQRAA